MMFQSLFGRARAANRKIAELEKNAEQIQTHIRSRNGHDAEEVRPAAQ